MRYRFARFCARMLVVFGAVGLVAGPLVGLAVVLLPLRENATPVLVVPLPYTAGLVVGTLTGLLAGLVLGVPLILAGQLVQVALDQRSLLVKIHRQLKRRGTEEVDDDRQDQHTRQIAQRYLKR